MASPSPLPHPLSNKHIVVAGAGISGLAFAISLHKLWPSVSSSLPPRITLYERDPCAVPKHREGYSLSIRSDNPSAGIQTLQKMGMLDLMMERSIATSGEQSDKKEGGYCVWKVSSEAGADGKGRTWDRVLKIASKRPDGCPVAGLRIARAELRRTLAEAVEQLPSVEIRWDSPISSISLSADKTIVVHQPNGATDTADLLIAADGSGSKIRSLLRPSDTLQFAGPTCIYARCPIADLHPSGDASEYGSVISGHGHGLFIAPVDHKSMVWCLSWHVGSPPLARKQPMPPHESEALLQEARQQGLSVYGERFENLLQSTDLNTVTKFNALDKPVFPHSTGYIQESSFAGLEGKVMFMGDANHAVSPFAGNGANLAMMDGWDFAESLVQTSHSSHESDEKDQGEFEDYLKNSINRYDSLAVGRAQKVIRMSRFSMKVMHSQGWWTNLWFTILRVMQWLFFRAVD
ncbi:hypothetical protein BKA66DRAFT_569334 [Pyrenochaeta sp. MPI-SDFR-AT-0127]|nr:hypothetical protein BKA66DRAFT_569334 [Pyrenochaeta sp. MPI-SDFR-AT-0127]